MRAAVKIPARGLPGTAAAPLLYWLLLVCGLAAFTVLRIDEPEKVMPLWAGTLMGAGLGQLLARRRVRPWLVGFIVLNAMWVLPLLVLPFWARGKEPPWEDVQTALMAFAPAALCGYLSLSERGALAAFWFPAALWMLSILDRSPTLSGRESWTLLGALTVLLVAFLRAGETRRAAIWRRHAMVRLAEPRGAAVLRRAPLRVAAQLAWMGMLGAASLALTAWIAPHLWQKEKLPNHPALASTQATAGGGPGDAAAGESCCPDEATVVDAHRRRVKEYFPLLRAHDEDVSPAIPSRCVACRDGVPIRVAGADGVPWSTIGPRTTGAASGTGPGGVTPVRPGGGFALPPPAVDQGEVQPAPLSPESTALAPVVPPVPVVPVAPSVPVVSGVTPPPRSPVAPGRLVRAPSGTTTLHPLPSPRVALARSDPGEAHPLEWFLTLAIIGFVLQVVMRPLRRLLTVRHLDRSLWPEAVDQRVSNLWQLMLVGLRDAGWHVVPGEQPRDLARRVGLEGMETCAVVLERVRHGVRVDAADLEAMTEAARSVYGAARRRAGWAARASGSLRWPLV